jgi:choice-of-anchor A domain-containing protein
LAYENPAANIQVNPDVMKGNCRIFNDPNAFGFEESWSELTSLSQQLFSSKSTGNGTLANQKLSLTFVPGNTQHIFTARREDFLLGVVTIIEPPVGLNDGDTIVFNIPGKNCGIANIDMQNLQNYNVLFNFAEAEQLTIKDVAVRGSILAPHAVALDTSGAVYGHFFINAATGSLQMNAPRFPSCRANSGEYASQEPTTTYPESPKEAIQLPNENTQYPVEQNREYPTTTKPYQKPYDNQNDGYQKPYDNQNDGYQNPETPCATSPPATTMLCRPRKTTPPLAEATSTCTENAPATPTTTTMLCRARATNKPLAENAASYGSSTQTSYGN